MKSVQSKKSVRVLIVDDHPIMRRGLSQTIEDEPGMEVCGEAADTKEALRQVKAVKPELAVIDISLGEGGNGIELIKEIKAKHPAVKMLVCSMHDDLLFAERVLRAGALGYVNKHEPTSTLCEALHRVMGGDVYLAPQMTARILHQMAAVGESPSRSPLESLSDRELEVFEMLGQGLITKQIAARLNLSHKTVETYRDHIKSKLNLKNSSELMRCAMQWTLEDN